MKRKKITAILLASLMGISAVPATTWAADSYKETEKAAFAKNDRGIWCRLRKEPF